MSRPIGATRAQHGTREPMFLYPKETSGSFPGPTESSSSHFKATVLLGTGEAWDWPGKLFHYIVKCNSKTSK